jgi:hypothetical protein
LKGLERLALGFKALMEEVQKHLQLQLNQSQLVKKQLQPQLKLRKLKLRK